MGRFGVTAEEAETTLALILTSIGERGRSGLRAHFLDQSAEVPEAGIALKTLNTYESAFDELRRRREGGS